MKLMRSALVVLVLSMFVAVCTPSVQAQEKKTIVTFSQPVEVPGQVLPAGTYTIKVVGMFSYRHIVQIFNEDGSKLVTTVLAIPNYRLQSTGKTVITFSERPADSPDALKAWFYPGDNFGQEFVYPKQRAIELAQVTKEAIPAIPTATTNLEELKEAPIVAITPEKKEVPVAEVIETAPPVLVAQNTASAELPATLPKTASELPLIALLAFASVGFAFVLKRIAG
jgi:hypothetical protein